MYVPIFQRGLMIACKIIITHYQARKKFSPNKMAEIFFSKLDLSDTDLQILIEEECSKLLTINTHKGLLKFDRLSLQIKVAPSIFQQIIDTMLTGLDCAQTYPDDILIKSKNRH